MDKELLKTNFIFVTTIYILYVVLVVNEKILYFLKFILISYIVFFITYYLFHSLIKKYSSKITHLPKKGFKFEVGSLIFLGSYITYAISIAILEIFARMTDNFWDSISCRGPGCVGFIGAIHLIPYLIFVIFDIVLFTKFFLMNTKFVKKNVRGFFSSKFAFFRSMCYFLIIFSLLTTYVYVLFRSLPWS